ncbi:MAG: glutamine--fructose-6-phosphate transaminase (isomerizing) [Deltaproteobacteria bacterium]|jgi:glucosamine--fructose-6-phosphate aminotransferase (isomerizing)|nr:glutamine--fructose-6-phosphate transaminase (isomerizing) [Deltaproteobacteria bacterium]
MCGIIAYTGYQAATPIIVEGLRRLEYRGYDSSGIAFVQQGQFRCIKAPGKLNALVDKLYANPNPMLATCGLGHTRWATHGAPSEANAHPHISNDRKFSMVHNGIIENYREIKAELTSKGYKFFSDTDTEVLLNLIAECRKTAPDNLSAFQRAIKLAHGTFALVLLCGDEPDTLYATRKSAPLIAGIGEHENFVSSDVTAFLAYTRKVIFPDEGELIRITPNTCTVFKLDNLAAIQKETQRIEWDAQSAQKGGFKHFMLKEICEQPAVLRSALAGRLDLAGGRVVLPELEGLKSLKKPERIRIIACGTSYNAGLWGSSLLEQWGNIPCTVEIASEFRYRKPLLSAKELVILISQSGETADTLAAVKVAKSAGCVTLGLCNVVGSSLARETDRVIYTQAGPEISVASTKALCSQMALLALLALYWARQTKTLSGEEIQKHLFHFEQLADLLEKELPEMREEAKDFAVRAASARNIFFLGRGRSFALALEGALKFKELSYVHAEAYAAGEMKHGPIALIDPEFLTIAIAPADEMFAKTFSNIEEIAARSGPILAIADKQGGKNIRSEQQLNIPRVPEPFTGFAILPLLQLLSYEAATYLGKDVDQPRNLAKSVTVE